MKPDQVQYENHNSNKYLTLFKSVSIKIPLKDGRHRPDPYCLQSKKKAIQLFEREDYGFKFKKSYSEGNFTKMCCRSCLEDGSCTRKKGVNNIGIAY